MDEPIEKMPPVSEKGERLRKFAKVICILSLTAQGILGAWYPAVRTIMSAHLGRAHVDGIGLGYIILVGATVALFQYRQYFAAMFVANLWWAWMTFMVVGYR